MNEKTISLIDARRLYDDVEVRKAAIINAVCRNELTIKEGEEAALHSSVGSLESWPPKARLNPKDEIWWSLASALVWISARNFEPVKIWADEFTPAYFERVGGEMIYHSCKPVSLLTLSKEIDIPACFHRLKNAATAGKIETTGKPDQGDERVKIDAFRWADLGFFGDVEGGIFVRDADSEGRITGGGFNDVLIKSGDLIAAFPERVHLNDVWERWVDEFHSDLIDPNRYRPAGNGVHYRNDKPVEYPDYVPSEYRPSDGGHCANGFASTVRRLTAFSQSGAMSSSGQWQIGNGGFEQTIAGDDKRIDGPRSWPALKIKKFDADVWLDQGEVESLFQGERDKRQLEKEIWLKEVNAKMDEALAPILKGSDSEISKAGDEKNNASNKRGRKPKAIREAGMEFLKELFLKNEQFEKGRDDWNCQAKAEKELAIFVGDEVKAESTIRKWVTEFLNDHPEYQLSEKADNS